jgi:hypothetical protein
VLFLMRSDASSMFHHWEDAPTLLVLLGMPEVQRAVAAQGLEVGGACARGGPALLSDL